MYKIEFKLEGLPKITANGRHSTWRAVHGARKRWKEAVAVAIGWNKPEVPLKKAKVTLIRVSMSRPDFDNLAISFKPVLDGLKNCGVLLDDTHDVIGRPEYDWQRGQRNKGHIIVRVEERSEHEENQEKDGEKDHQKAGQES